MQKHVNLLDLVKSFPTNIYYLLAKFGVDTAENEPLKVNLILHPWDLIFTEPPRPVPFAAGFRCDLPLASLPAASAGSADRQSSRKHPSEPARAR